MGTGVFGGTFDPVHMGHLAIAAEARLRFKLSQIIFVPAGQPWLKMGRTITPAGHRIEMVKRAIGSSSSLRVSTIEVDRPGLSYTVDTMAVLQEELGVGVDLFFILGCDSLAELPRWKQPARLVARCKFIAVPRPPFNSPDLETLEASIPGISQRVILLDMPPIDVSSSDVRKRVAGGLSIEGLVPAEVERYIREQELYSG